MYKKIVGIAVIACSLAFSQISFAHSWSCGKGLQQIVSSLKLTDEQKEKIKPVMAQLKSSIKDNALKMKALDTQISQQVGSDKMDQTVVNGLVDQKAVLIGNMMKAKIMAKNQIAMVLDASQKSQLQSMMKDVEAKMVAKYKSCHDQD